MKQNLLYSCLGISFMLVLLGFLFVGMLRHREEFDISSCYDEYICNLPRLFNNNPFYNRGRRWRYYGNPQF